MTRLWNDPANFADDMTADFVRANGRWVRRVHGGVSRSTRSAEPEVAVVIGGGSGHYPAFGGLVGPGLAHGTAMGNLFASPSAHQVEPVIRSSEQGLGALLPYGNYAGDVLHVDDAQERVRRDGIDCRTVVITDDIFSASPDEQAKRCGIAGDLTAFKAAGAASAAGYNLDGTERVARLANARTRSMGVAFTGCTLPGADEPLFSVPEGRMAIGLGIHGEPGIDETDIPSADGLAELFADAEVPDGVADLLEEAGITLVDPQVGEFCTSFDMAGASLTLFWLDEELEPAAVGILDGLAAAGAQDLAAEDAGAFTGEVSGAQIRELGGGFVEVGHAERRRLFGETDEVVRRKVDQALGAGLVPILCLGEEAEQDPDDAARERLRQLDDALALARERGHGGRIVVAYEPQWAIGADAPASDAHIRGVCRELRAHARARALDVHPGSSVMYGGSAGPGLLTRTGDDVDGLFFGRFAHDPRAIAAILDEVHARAAARPAPDAAR